MIITNTIEELKKNLKGRDVNVTIGNFDGVHLGHRDFLSKIKDESNNLNRKFLAITFIPHPVFVLNARPHFLINTYVDRRKLLQDMGVDFLL
jgi:riboflavin kinase/FMN adenylyltransferase